MLALPMILCVVGLSLQGEWLMLTYIIVFVHLFVIVVQSLLQVLFCRFDAEFAAGVSALQLFDVNSSPALMQYVWTLWKCNGYFPCGCDMFSCYGCFATVDLYWYAYFATDVL